MCPNDNRKQIKITAESGYFFSVSPKVCSYFFDTVICLLADPSAAFLNSFFCCDGGSCKIPVLSGEVLNKRLNIIEVLFQVLNIIRTFNITVNSLDFIVQFLHGILIVFYYYM